MATQASANLTFDARGPARVALCDAESAGGYAAVANAGASGALVIALCSGNTSNSFALMLLEGGARLEGGDDRPRKVSFRRCFALEQVDATRLVLCLVHQPHFPLEPSRGRDRLGHGEIGVVAVTHGPDVGPLANRGYHLMNLDSAGDSKGEAFIFGTGLAIAGDPQGGVLFAGELATSSYQPYQRTATPRGPVARSAVMLEGGGAAPAVRWGPAPLASKGTVFGAGVDTAQRSLIITNGTAQFGAGAISAQWFDRNGTALTGEFLLLTGFVPGASTWFETSPLIGSGLMVRRMDGPSRARALLTVESGADWVQPAPDWMVARPDTRLQIVRGGLGYAALPYAAKNVACTQRLELIAADGTSCGSRDYPIAGGNCDTHDLTLGADGTVFQQLPDAMESQGPTLLAQSCTWHWWAGAAK